MSTMEFDSSDSESDSSDDILEDVAFLTKSSPARSQTEALPNYSPLKNGTGEPSIGSKLDALLSGHKKEVVRDELHKKLKVELLHSIEQGSQEDMVVTDDGDSEPLHGKLAEHIEQLDVTTQASLTDKPAITVFHPNKFCCLFKENISPFSCGFSRSQFSKIDKLLATLKPEGLTPLLLSNTLPSCLTNISSRHNIMIWLLSLLSIHANPMVVDLCTRNMTSIIPKFRLCQKREDGQPAREPWKPKPIELIRILVNMGATPIFLVGDQTLYTDADVREFLCVQNDENDSMPMRSPGKVKLENCRCLVEILTQCFLQRPDYTKNELNLIFCVIMKVSLDTTFQNLALHRTFQACLSSLLECYKESDWPSVVPTLCHQLSSVPQHHRLAVYLVDLLPVSQRGIYLQIRLSFEYLCVTLEPDREEECSRLQLESVSPSLIAQLGHDPPNDPSPSHLYSRLQKLIENDVLKMNSALTLLDRAVGDETNRIAQPKEELEFLTKQVKMLIKDIRDSINTLDLSRIKDRMTVMTVKWMMISVQRTKSIQRSLFSWVTSTSHTTVYEEKLKDDVSNTMDDNI